MADSSTGGILVPAASPAPLEDQALDRFLQQLVAAVTALPGASVRPRWQKEPPNMPANGADWAAVGVTDMYGDTFAVEAHSGEDDGSSSIIRHELVDVLVSFYGDNARSNAAKLRDGLALAQNREILIYRDMGLVSVGRLTPAPTLANERWQYRVDIAITFVRAIRRVYPILNLASTEGEIVTDNTPPLSEPINVSE